VRPSLLTYTECVRGTIPTIALALMLTGGPTVAADNLELSFRDGRVTIIAIDVPVRAILQEWSRVGETEFIEADELPGRPVQLQLVDVPEAKALRILLRQAAGYVAAPRAKHPVEGSRFDRVLVMATSQGPVSSSYQPSLGSSASVPVPAQRGPMSVPRFSPDLYPDEIEELQQLLPEPVNPIDRSAQPDDDQRSGGATASRPGMIVVPSNGQPAVFLRGRVPLQAPEDPGK